MAKRAGEKYAAILNAAVRVFSETGYHRAQVARIAKEAGVADGTVYLYFKNKEDILISLFQEKMGEFIARIENDISSVDSAPEKLFRIIQSHFTLLGENPAMARVTQIELRQADVKIAEGIHQSLKQYFRLIESIISEGQFRGELKPNLDVKLMRKMIFGTMDEVVTSWVMSKRQEELKSLSEQVFLLLSEGIISKK